MLPARLTFAPALLGLAVLALSACQQQPAGSAEATAAPEAKPGLTVTEGRLMLPVVKGNPAGIYFTLTNTGDKAGTLAAVSIDGAAKAEMHETKGGKMSAVPQIEVAAGGTVRFEPGALHVMAFELDDKLAAGGTAEMTLTFADGDKLSVPLKIEARAAGEGMAGGMAGMDQGSGH
ncbi:copper chaperone PCu(A)C [Novosphingobium sp.]|uniref:copper chaperone PCu(A)C n=1 Tax=Novosphingobium sp. TaxID=1874826 RepID=UPI002732C80C|nr:copper chaperone PCu(A)C [Novosphingobium sp.]MDP3905685.1 copper chaperone PCu(A)C [Novosphingobium sp.]